MVILKFVFFDFGDNIYKAWEIRKIQNFRGASENDFQEEKETTK